MFTARKRSPNLNITREHVRTNDLVSHRFVTSRTVGLILRQWGIDLGPHGMFSSAARPTLLCQCVDKRTKDKGHKNWHGWNVLEALQRKKSLLVGCLSAVSIVFVGSALLLVWSYVVEVRVFLLLGCCNGGCGYRCIVGMVRIACTLR